MPMTIALHLGSRCVDCDEPIHEKRTRGGRWRVGCCGTYFYAQKLQQAWGAWRAYWEIKLSERIGEQDCD